VADPSYIRPKSNEQHILGLSDNALELILIDPKVSVRITISLILGIENSDANNCNFQNQIPDFILSTRQADSKKQEHFSIMSMAISVKHTVPRAIHYKRLRCDGAIF